MSSCFWFYLFLPEVWLTDNIVLFAGVEHCNSVLLYNLQIIFHYILLQDIEDSFRCYTIDLCWLSTPYMLVCICEPQTPNLSPHFLVTMFVFCVCESVSVL